MTDERALLAAIIANPDDDTLRLAYADYLDELGGEVNQARAEYVRIQIHRQRWPEDPTDSARESELYVKHQSRWRVTPPAGFVVSMGYRRGFPHRAKATASAVLAAIDDPFTQLLEEFDLQVDVELSRFRDLTSSAVFRRLVRWELSIGEDVTNSVANRLIVMGEFPRLESLTLPGVSEEELRILSVSRGFPKLNELHLDALSISESGLQAIVESRSLASLRRLYLSRMSTSHLSRRMVDRLHKRFGAGLWYT